MKRNLSFMLILAIIISMFITIPISAEAAKRATVYVTVNIDGKTVLAAQPVTVKKLTVESALIAAHTMYFKGGEAGFKAGKDSTYGMYMINTFWGVSAIPYVILNGAPLGGGENASLTADTAAISDGDNIIVSVSTPAPPPPAPSVTSLTAEISGDSAKLTATAWTFNSGSYSYSSKPYAKAKIIDENGKALGETDNKGILTVKKTSGLVKIEGAAAVVIGAVSDKVSTDSATVNVTVNVDGVTKISAAPVTVRKQTAETKVDAVTKATTKPVEVNELTVDAVLKAVHEQHYEGGSEGYTSGIDSTWNMFLVTKFWGISTIPYIILNGAPLGAGANSKNVSADTCPVKDGDNIIVTIISSSSTGSSAATIPVVSLIPFESEGETTLSALKWSLDTSNFSYNCIPYEGATVVDETGAVLGVTDSNGSVTIKKTEGVAKIEGAAAIHLGVVIPVGNEKAEKASVNVTVNIDGKTQLLAQIVTVKDDLTVDEALRMAHIKYFKGGEDGYEADIDSSLNMFMISKFWGIETIPYVILNDAPLGGGKNASLTADTAVIKDGDNIIVTLGTPAPSMIASMTSAADDDKTTLTLTSWRLDFTTFTYIDTPYTGAVITDENGALLGTTDSDGSLTILKTSGVAKVDGIAAVNVGTSDKQEVNLTVNVDGVTTVLAKPVAFEGEQTVDGILKAAHELYFKGGADGYTAGTDKTYNMFLINKIWGVNTVPYVMLNGAPLGAGENSMLTADTATVKAGDNLIVTVFSPSYQQPASKQGDIVSLTAITADGKATLTAGLWTLNTRTYTYKTVPYAGAVVTDEAGNKLGTTDKNGNLTVGKTSGIVKIDGVAAYRFGTSTPKRSDQTIKVNGSEKKLEVYNINGSNYFKLRDIAFLMNKSGSQFSVSFDDKLQAIQCKTGEAYTPNDSEMKIGADLSDSAVPSSQALYINGQSVTITAYNLGGNNYFALRDLGKLLNFMVDYDAATRTVLVKSK
jgi:hypothetical protein